MELPFSLHLVILRKPWPFSWGPLRRNVTLHVDARYFHLLVRQSSTYQPHLNDDRSRSPVEVVGRELSQEGGVESGRRVATTVAYRGKLWLDVETPLSTRHS
jgi:hypothetical protein